MTSRFGAGIFEVDGGVRGSAEKEAAKTKPSSRRWRVRVCAYAGLKVDRLVTIVEPSIESVEIRKRGWEMRGSFLVLLMTGGE